MYDEFDDCRRRGPYCSSLKARYEMKRLAKEHNLGYMYTAKGGLFHSAQFRCSIGTKDDVEDLNTLRQALTKRNVT